MPAPSFVAPVSDWDSQILSGGVTPSEPANAAQNHIIRADLYLEIEADPVVTPPGGWSNLFAGLPAVVQVTMSAKQHWHFAYWIRRGASAPSYAFTWTGGNLFGSILVQAFSGAVTTEHPWSFLATAKRETVDVTFPAVSGTTLTNDELLSWVAGFYTIATTGSTPPYVNTPDNPFTERYDLGDPAEQTAADRAQATAGATGTITGAGWTGTGNPATVIMAGLKSVAVPGGGGQAPRSFHQYAMRRNA